jgi:hypothetical protein
METSMDDLTYTLRQLCLRNRDGSFATQVDRQRSLTLAARQLREAGFRQMHVGSLKGKHIEVVIILNSVDFIWLAGFRI